MGIYSTFLSEFEVHWYNALRRGDPGSPFPLPPNLQYLRPQIANLVNATFGVDSTPQQQISSQANEGPSHPNPVIGQQNAPILQPQQQQQIVRMALQLLQSHPQLRGLAPQELITMSADDWRQRGWNEQEIKLLEIARPHILAFPQQQQQSSQEQAPVYPTQARLLEMQRLQKLVRAQAQAQAQAHAQAQAQAPQNHEPLLSQTPTPQLSNMPQPQPGEVGMPQGLDQAQDIPHGPLGVQPITPAANSHAQQLVHPLEPPHQTQQQPNIQPNPFSDPLPDLSHLQAWPSLDQLAQADAHIQRLLREAVRQLELERPVPTYDIAEDLLYNEKFQYIGTIAPHLKQCLVPLYVFAPKEKNALKVAICDLVKVMEQQRLMKAGQKVYLFTPQELDMISAQWKKLLTYHEHVLRAAEKLPGFPQTPQQQQQQPMLPSATMLHPSTQPQLPLGTPSVPQHPNVGVEQPVAHDNTRFAPVGQHPSPPADSLPSVEQSRLQPSANDVASPPSPALETPASPIEGSITTIATSPKTPNSPLVASETPKGEPGKHPTCCHCRRTLIFYSPNSTDASIAR
ncbi:hypothetical protein FRC03_006810 [Tulasnella sp. 419]|nr:hypothetical protein FRC03_006810 [Tulasnella sp. 419]